MQKELYRTRNTDKNEKLIQLIKCGLVDLDKKVEKMSKDGMECEKQYDIKKCC